MNKKPVSPFDPAYKGEVAKQLMEHKRVHGKKAKQPTKASRDSHNHQVSRKK
jgi:hypothetical protein